MLAPASKGHQDRAVVVALQDPQDRKVRRVRPEHKAQRAIKAWPDQQDRRDRPGHLVILQNALRAAHLAS